MGPGPQKSFLLTETAIYIVEQQKESMGYRFVPECNHTQESLTCQCFSFSLSAKFAGPRFVIMRNYVSHKICILLLKPHLSLCYCLNFNISMTHLLFQG